MKSLANFFIEATSPATNVVANYFIERHEMYHNYIYIVFPTVIAAIAAID